MADVEMRETGLEATRPEVRPGVPDAGVAGLVPQQGRFDDLKDRIFEVRLETERVRTDLAKLSDQMTGESGKLRVEMVEMKIELIDRMTGESGKLRVEMGEMEDRLSERISGVEVNLRGEIADMKKSAGRWMAFGMSFITVLVALVALLS